MTHRRHVEAKTAADRPLAVPSRFGAVGDHFSWIREHGFDRLDEASHANRASKRWGQEFRCNIN
jgi:hypothetical protein